MKTIKSAVRAAVMLLIGCAFLGCIHYIVRHQLPELSDIAAFDPSVYETTCAQQSLKLKPDDRQWTLRTIQYYTADGELDSERIYRFLKDGRSYSAAVDENGRGGREDSAYLSEKTADSYCGYLADGSISEERYDQYGRLTFRRGCFPRTPETEEFIYLYYCPESDNLPLTDALSAMVVISHSTADGDAPYLDGDFNYVSESTSYSIRNFDQYGNELYSEIGGECCLQADMAGYLGMIIIKEPTVYHVTRTAPTGKPLWEADYDRESLELLSYMVYEYQAA